MKIPECKICGSIPSYNLLFDAYYCHGCKKWKEDKCHHPDCKFCVNRPDKPVVL